MTVKDSAKTESTSIDIDLEEYLNECKIMVNRLNSSLWSINSEDESNLKMVMYRTDANRIIKLLCESEIIMSEYIKMTKATMDFIKATSDNMIFDYLRSNYQEVSDDTYTSPKHNS